MLDDFESELNVIHQILKNDKEYTKLIIGNEHFNHYGRHEIKYCLTYKHDTFSEILIDVLSKNVHINEIYTSADFTNDMCTYVTIKKIIKMKNWKSIFMCGYSCFVLDVLSIQQNPKLIKLTLSQIHLNSDLFLKIVKNTPSLEYFDLDYGYMQTVDLHVIAQGICESNIKTFIVNDICLTNECTVNFINDIIKCKLRNLHLKTTLSLSAFNLQNNYTLLNFTINNKCPVYAQDILKRNEQYIFIILLCMNKKIIPRCVFKNLILSHLFKV